MKASKTSNFTGTGIDDEGNIQQDLFNRFNQYFPTLDTDIKKVFSILNGQVSFGISGSQVHGENVSGQWVTVADTGTANAEFAVPHTFQFQGKALTPANYIVTNINKAGIVYTSGTTWTTSNVYFKCSAANATVTIFLMR